VSFAWDLLPGDKRAGEAEAAMDSIPAILKIDAGGLPVAWIHWQTAVVLYAREPAPSAS
jgi:hypothetical protein